MNAAAGRWDEADVVEIPGADDDCVVRRRSSTFIPRKLPKKRKPGLSSVTIGAPYG
jgi:hypothetical protein